MGVAEFLSRGFLRLWKTFHTWQSLFTVKIGFVQWKCLENTNSLTQKMIMLYNICDIPLSVNNWQFGQGWAKYRDIWDTDKSWYFVITEFIVFIIVRSQITLWKVSEAICHFHARVITRRRKRGFIHTWAEYNLDDTAHLSRPLFAGNYLQIMWWAFGQWKGREICIKW